MKISRALSFAAVVLLGTVSAFAETGDLKIRFEYGAEAPEREPINADKDAAFCGKVKLLDETLIVNKENKGIQNVIVFLTTSRRGPKLPEITPPKNTHVLANDKCRFEPRVVIAQTGDTLKVTNPDAVGHNANLGFFNNPAENFTIPAGGEKSVVLEESEPTAMPVVCNIHPWMKANIVVLDHPFAAVSDENGDLIIKGIPAGEWTFRVNHEAGSIKEVKIDGKTEEWKLSKFKVDIKPGLNDLGTVVVPESFKK